MNFAQPASDSGLTQIRPSAENQPAASGSSSSADQHLHDAPPSLFRESYTPLTPEERWHYFWKDTMLSPTAYFGVLGGAFAQQLAGQPQQWGKGFSGYTKRAGVSFVQFGVQESIHQGGAALLHTDPRYLSCECSGGLHRTWHALEMSFLTFKDNGKKTLDLPMLAAAYGGAMIAEVPYPSHYSPLVQGVQNGHIQIGANMAINLFKEFSPELARMNPFRRHAVPE
jgi:hypothetical protein